MIRLLKCMVRKILPARIVYALRVLYRGIPPRSSGCSLFDYDKERFYEHSACSGGAGSREGMRAGIIMSYHIVEKGLTMPNRRYGFGVEEIRKLIRKITDFESHYGRDEQVDHATGVVREYFDLHANAGKMESVGDAEYWQEIQRFLGGHEGTPAASQIHVCRSEFYSHNESPFPKFAWSRHTVRHYSDKGLSVDKIKQAVDLARSTPTACNRQHCRAYCVSDKLKMTKLLEIQKGNRGFGHLADKVLVVTADLEDTCTSLERYDVFINGGMFLMNLCYALHYHKVAHCILNWSRTAEEDRAMRDVLSIKPSESVIALLACGEAPEEFDLASSPREKMEEYFSEL